MTKVAITKCLSYEKSIVRESLHDLLSLIGGVSEFISPGDRVAIKPNLLRAAIPDKAITTDPRLLSALIEEIKSVGAHPFITESPAGMNRGAQISQILRQSGIGDLCKEFDIPFILPDKEVVEVEVPSAVLYNKLSVGKTLVEADKIISVAKLKTHGLTGLTAAVKNMFGSIPGLEKARFHLRVPDKAEFSNLLLDIYLAVKPDLSIIDGIAAMDGAGPSAGQPFDLGCLLASTNGPAADIVASKIVGFEFEAVSTNKPAVDRGMTPSFADIQILGCKPEEINAKGFVLPVIPETTTKHRFLRRFARSALVVKPAINVSVCQGCGICEESCPARAITGSKKRSPVVDEQRCITCLCCSEVCPATAIIPKASWLAHLFDLLK